MPSLLPGHYAAVKVRKELYVTGRPGKDEEASPERKAAASVKEFRYPLIKNSENQTER